MTPTTTVPLEAKSTAWLFGIPIPLNQQTKKGVSPLAGVIDPSYQREIRLLVDNIGKEDHV